jgi:hypothetical protein
MRVAEAMDELNDVLCRQLVPQDEVLTVIGTVFKFAGTTPTSAREVVYFAADGQPAIRLTYTRKGNITARADAGLDDELASAVVGRVRTLVSADEPVVWRQVWFSSLPLTGYWRYRDEWQIVPVPDDAARPESVVADHPLLIEVRGVGTGDPLIDRDRLRRRLWELQLILSLALRVSISTNDRSPPHAWVLVEDLKSGLRSEYRQRGYALPNPTFLENEFSSIARLNPVPTVNDRDYYARRSDDGHVDVPALLPSLLDRYAAAAPAERDTFLRACHWLSRSKPAARLSLSLAYISVINSIEVLVPDAVRDPCPHCALDRAPGVTVRFRQLVDRYAHGVEGVNKLYDVRSKLVHGRAILDRDLPAAWGSFHPDEMEQSDRYDLARRTATAVIINWFLDPTRSSS